ncbi:MAG: NAD-dependent epimerase/dehydratase family protein [Pseudomonadota bacterium]
MNRSVLVTGATGLLGAAVVRALTDQGDRVIALTRRIPKPEVFAGLDVEVARGDLADTGLGKCPNWLSEAVSRSAAVIHCAAHIHIGSTQVQRSLAVNHRGTQAIATACLLAQRPLVNVATVNTLALGSRDNPANESTPVTARNAQTQCAYTVSKAAAVAAVEAATAKGLKAITVHPGFMLGPWDWRPSSGQMIHEIARRSLLLAPSGGCSVCDSRDVAKAIVGALDADVEPGRSFVLAGFNVTYLALLVAIADRLGRKPPIGVAPLWAQRMVGQFGNLTGHVRGHEPFINSASCTMGTQFHWYDSTRAKTELGYTNRPLAQTLDDAVNWVQRYHC